MKAVHYKIFKFSLVLLAPPKLLGDEAGTLDCQGLDIFHLFRLVNTILLLVLTSLEREEKKILLYEGPRIQTRLSAISHQFVL